MGNKSHHCQTAPYLARSCPKTLCPRVAATRFVYAQVYATDEKMFLVRSPRWPTIEERTKIGINTSTSNGITQHTRMPCLSQFTTSRTCTCCDVLSSEAHLELSAKCAGANFVYCSIEGGDLLAQRLVQDIEVTRKSEVLALKFGPNI